MLSDKLSLQTISVRQGELEMPVIRCPHCKTGSDFKIVASARNPNRLDGNVLSCIGLCLLCGGEVYMHLNRENKDAVVDSYPPLEESVPSEGIPPDVSKALSEAFRSYRMNAPNASLCMSRRAIHETVKDLTKGWDKPRQAALLKDSLPAQLQKLVEEELIPPVLKDWADQPRIGGKLAAHGTGGEEWGEPDKVWGTQEDAKEVIDFCLSVLEYAYVMPTRLENRRKPPEGK